MAQGALFVKSRVVSMIGLTDVEQPYTLGGMDYPHLRLTRWPFPTVPEQEFCDFIADRKQLCDEIEGLLSTLSGQDTSSIHLVWSWFGAGKTHTLYYFANRANRGASDHQQLRAVYSEFPKAARSFVDLYRSFAAGLDFDEVIDAYLEIATSPTAEKFKRVVTMASPDLFTALHVLATGTVKDQMTAMRWLRGDTLAASELSTGRYRTTHRHIGGGQSHLSSDHTSLLASCSVS